MSTLQTCLLGVMLAWTRSLMFFGVGVALRTPVKRFKLSSFFLCRAMGERS
jgi:hypothetical protein